MYLQRHWTNTNVTASTLILPFIAMVVFQVQQTYTDPLVLLSLGSWFVIKVTRYHIKIDLSSDIHVIDHNLIFIFAFKLI